MKLINRFLKKKKKLRKRNLQVLNEEVKVVGNKDLRKNKGLRKNDSKYYLYLKFYLRISKIL